MAEGLVVENLTVGYHWENGFSKIINDLSLSIEKGIIFGIAGESGSGKSTFAQSIYNSLSYPGEIISGKVYFEGKDLLKTPKNELRRIRAVDITFIPQAAMNALNTLNAGLAISSIPKFKRMNANIKTEINIAGGRIHHHSPTR